MSAPAFDDGWAKRKIPAKKSNPSDYQWATYIDNRRPGFKVHRTLGHAHAAIAWKTYQRRISSDMALYVKEGDEWVVQYEWCRGDHVTHFPWQSVPPTEAEILAVRTREDWGRIQRQLMDFVDKLPADQRSVAARSTSHFLAGMNQLIK